VSWYTAYVIVILICAFGIAIAFWCGSRPDSTLRFSSRRKLLNDDQLVFIRALELALHGRYRIVTTARLSDLVEPHESLRAFGRRRLFEKMNAIVLDCVLCDEQTFEVLAAIQLNRSKRRSGKAAEEDRFVEVALRSANTHLIRMPLQPLYSAALIATQVESVMSRDFIETLTLTTLPTEVEARDR